MDLKLKGKRVRLLNMDDPQAPPDGAMGTIQFTDDLGSIHVSWDTGGSLAIVPGIDKYIILEEKEAHHCGTKS